MFPPRARLTAFSLLFAFSLVFVSAVSSQIPQLLGYQGRVLANGANFTGSGAFRFALVNQAGNVTYWSNDGTSSNGSPPAGAVTLTVDRGLYSILLGDTTLVNMTAIPATVFNSVDVRLRVWFNDGTNGTQQLAPDQRIAAVGYAVIAGNVPDGAITAAKLAPGAVTSASIAAGAISGAQLAAGAAASNLAASGQSGVASGGTILSANPNSAALASAGYVVSGTAILPDFWQVRAATNAPSPRSYQTAVWTGSEMIVWGGLAGGTTATYLADGARFNAATNSWNALPASGAPSARIQHTAVWTGTQMIVWGGVNASTPGLGDGARFSPSSNAWQTMASSVGRRLHTAVWSGTEMIVWGGENTAANTLLADGRRYDPAGDSWTGIPSPPAGFAARIYHSAVWTGTDMIIYGGATNVSALPFTVASTGASYNRAGNSWTNLPLIFAPAGRALHSVVWTGTDMIVWGGFGSSGALLNDGGRYIAGSASWTALPNVNAPAARERCPVVWTGSTMIVWGGDAGGGAALADGGQYDPLSNMWTATTQTGAPPARALHDAVWTGANMLVFGGSVSALQNAAGLNDTWAYTPSRTMYLYSQP